MKALLLACLLMTGCATHLVGELEHVSHPLVGWPVSNRLDEDALTQANLLLRWKFDHDRGYVDAGFGLNLQGNNGGGFYGPALTGTLRLGYEIPLRTR